MNLEFGSAGKGTNFRIIGDDFLPDQHLLLTLTNSQGEESFLVSNDRFIPTKSKHFVQAPKERIVVKRNPAFSNFLKTVQFIGYGLLGVLMVFTALSFTGAMKSRVVLTGSMVPAINPGDIVITVPLKNHVPVVGDVVTYEAKRFNGEGVGVFTHRIIDGDITNGFIVKGDHNPSPDIQRPKAEDILGTVVFRIPFLGHLITPRALAILIPTIIGLWLVIDSMISN